MLMVFAVVMLLCAIYAASERDWWSSAGFVLLFLFFIWICFQFRI